MLKNPNDCIGSGPRKEQLESSSKCPHSPGVLGQFRPGPNISPVTKKGEDWAMSRDDVRMGGYGTSSGHSKPLARSSRRDGLTSSTMHLIHQPTGLRVDGTVPRGHYSRKEMVKERERLHKHLWDELERKVANHLRIPGRQGAH